MKTAQRPSDHRYASLAKIGITADILGQYRDIKDRVFRGEAVGSEAFAFMNTIRRKLSVFNRTTARFGITPGDNVSHGAFTRDGGVQRRHANRYRD